MRPEEMTPDLILDGVGYRLEQRAELVAWLLLRPYRGVAFPDLARTRARFAETIPVHTPRQDTPDQLTFGWHMGVRRDMPCAEV
jgi:hypothetical protein